ncbi:yitI [Symbiodinium pilosum]|uniref:YitI protein n=1 Tax=Symbiodinium pilosum TaxID=2952 RepID=A0A812WM36_SYMPI|nr:yitI [Symbiodinium pilosum]
MEDANQAEVVELGFEETYPLREAVLWPGRPDLAALDCDPHGKHWGMRRRGELVSVISVFVDGDGREAQFRKFATALECQGQGLGSILLKHVMDQAQQQGVHRLWCNARSNQAGFYEKRGMQPADGGATFLKNGVEYICMEMDLRDSP